jgi:hypothetical protein
MAEVRVMVERWRKATQDITETSKRLEAARATFDKEDRDHLAAVTTWDTQKAAQDKAVEESTRVVEAAEARAAAAVRDAEAAEALASDQRRRNTVHLEALERHRAEVSAEAARVERRDAAPAQQLTQFRSARHELRRQLQGRLAKLQEALPALRREVATQLQTFGARAADARQTLDADERAWRRLVAARRSEARHALSDAIVAEVAACEQTRRECRPVQDLCATLPPRAAFEAELDAIRAMLQVHRAPALAATA